MTSEHSNACPLPVPPRKKPKLSLQRPKLRSKNSVEETMLETNQGIGDAGSTLSRRPHMTVAQCSSATTSSIIIPDEGDESSCASMEHSPTGSFTVTVSDLLNCPFCPSCQMPLVGRDSVWSNRHVTDCLDFPSKPSAECSCSAECTSCLPSHFRKYRHSILAARRCNVSLPDAPHSVSLPSSSAAAATTASSRRAEVIGPMLESSPKKMTVTHPSKPIYQPPVSNVQLVTTPDRARDRAGEAPPSPAARSKERSEPQQGTLASYFGFKIPPPPADTIQSPPKAKQSSPWGGFGTSTGHQMRGSSWSRGASQAGQATTRHNTSPAGQAASVEESDGAGMSAMGGKKRKQCPFYKKIPDTCFTVDAFCYGTVEGCKAYFLSHFHSDHYQGLSKTFSHPIYCTKSTGNLCVSQLRVKRDIIHSLNLHEPTNIHGVLVTLVDANHCPGSVMFVFQLPDGRTVLHTGDFRSAECVIHDPHLRGLKYDTIYLDTTYLDPKYDFPPQDACVQFAVEKSLEAVSTNPKTIIVSGTYSIGKEKIFLAIAQALQSKVAVTSKKKAILDQLDWPELTSRLTTNWDEAQVHVLPMMQISFKGMRTHLQEHGGGNTAIVGFRPTGWTQNNKTSVHASGSAMPKILPSFQEGMILYGIPYSEHSSFSELKRFIQHFRPRSILPTVNMGSASARDQMQHFFRQWQST